MQQVLSGFALYAVSFAVLAAGASPSSVMRQIPAVPDPVTAASCDVTEPLLAGAEQRAMADMMRSQQLAMGAMNAGGGAVSDRQGQLIGRLADPALNMCEMNAAQAFAGHDVDTGFQAELDRIRSATSGEIEAKCPVIGMADYRDEACVTPITRRGLVQEHQALRNYIAAANAALAREIDGYARCAEAREQLAEEAEAAALPAQYLSMAHGGRAQGWQMVGGLGERYRHYCQTALREADYLRQRETQ